MAEIYWDKRKLCWKAKCTIMELDNVMAVLSNER